MNEHRLSRRSWVAGSLAGVSSAKLAHATQAGTGPWVVVWLRGGADGLSLVVPYRERGYYEARPNISIPTPATPGGALAIEDEWALHPGLSSLKALYEARELAMAVGVRPTDAKPGHREAGESLRRELSALVGAAPSDASAFTSLAPSDRVVPLREQLIAAARLAASDARPRIFLTELDGWDTHFAQGKASARLTGPIRELADALLAYRAAMGAHFRRVPLFVVSEFGRGLHETLVNGTDDGHPGICLAMGGPFVGGRVVGRWPWFGLANPTTCPRARFGVAEAIRALSGDLVAAR